ncbi:hypothetical protein [Myceligenerans pegani]|uniref:Secreted protein n=1 Tax=Myceligenerans pegani TaxID=2776917 RepID=A0ABR9MTX3_9MICO|nr:hypothetical protein [Myceligenerans sp. TRM 65318]MBE1874819.1 hypothetical protein [Myceligenerans sp. TRM 65318]MBE3017090.1 hypothetical protein [Myceligenerans sp. TRM 65318]
MTSTTGARGVRFAGLAGVLLASALLAGCAGGDTTGGAEDGAADEETTVGSTPSDTAGPGDEESDMDDDGARNVRPTIEAKAIDPLEAGATGTGLPEGIEGSTSSPAGAAWSPAAGLIYVVTNDSSSCPVIAEPEATEESGEVVVGLLPRREGMCTADWVPTTSVVQAPDGVEDGAAVAVRLGDKGTLNLPAREADGEPGPIAWVAN